MQEYNLPNFSHLLPCTIKVQYKEKSDITKIKHRVQMINTNPSDTIKINNNFKKINRNIKQETTTLINNNESVLKNVIFCNK